MRLSPISSFPGAEMDISVPLGERAEDGIGLVSKAWAEAGRERSGNQEGLPQSRKAASPGPEQGQSGRGEALRGSDARLRHAFRQEQARPVRSRRDRRGGQSKDAVRLWVRRALERWGGSVGRRSRRIRRIPE